MSAGKGPCAGIVRGWNCLVQYFFAGWIFIFGYKFLAAFALFFACPPGTQTFRLIPVYRLFGGLGTRAPYAFGALGVARKELAAVTFERAVCKLFQLFLMSF